MNEYVKAKLNMIKYYRHLAKDTDYIMPLWLPFLPAILAIIGFFAWLFMVLASMGLGYVRPTISPSLMRSPIAASGFGAFLVSIIVAAMINIYVLYKWISRRNDHFKRVRKLYREMVDLLNSISKDKKPAGLATLESIVKEMEIEETERSAIIWIILTFIASFLLLYIYHFLNRDFYKHELRESMMAENLSQVLKELGSTKIPRKLSFETIPKRNTVLYIVLTLLTLGVFTLYWIYTITKDPNEHFKLHRIWEDDIIYCFETLITGSTT